MSTLRALSIAGLLLALLPASLALGADGTPAGGGEGEEPSFFERLKAKLLRSENSHVERGNEHMAAAEHAAALEAYNSAARELPAEGGVHLDRGLALLATGDLPAAREALSLASHPPASKAVRADAYYNLGLAFYTEADQLAASEDHQGAQQLFREAVDALKRSLRLRPGDPNTAWNYELALRRLREEEQKQQEQEQDQDQQNQDQQNQDQQHQH
ncbi:MAG: hypothetical protein OXT09_36180, partial [Myxococcales bacterium]|nr:hypothetical protein [Myxococcales bacterium]